MLASLLAVLAIFIFVVSINDKSKLSEVSNKVQQGNAFYQNFNLLDQIGQIDPIDKTKPNSINSIKFKLYTRKSKRKSRFKI